MTASGALLPLGRIDADGSSCPKLCETLTPTELDAEIGPVGHDRGDGCRKAQNETAPAMPHGGGKEGMDDY